MESRGWRAVRGCVAGSFATGIAALAHGIADGMPPSPLAIVVGLAFAGMLGTFAVGRGPSLPRLGVIVAGSQLAFHLVFVALTPGGSAGGGHHDVPALLTPAGEQLGADPGMSLAHAAAMLATLAFLRRAELALWNLLQDALAATRILRLPLGLSARGLARPLVPGVQPRHPLPASFLSVLSRRGPPPAAPAP